MTASIFAGPEAAGGQEVSGARRWPFRPDKTDLQVNKHRGLHSTVMTSSEMDFTLRVSQYLLESINHGGSLPSFSVCLYAGQHDRSKGLGVKGKKGKD